MVECINTTQQQQQQQQDFSHILKYALFIQIKGIIKSREINSLLLNNLITQY